MQPADEILIQACRAGAGERLLADLAAQIADLAAQFAPSLNPVLAARGVAAWAQLFGLPLPETAMPVSVTVLVVSAA